MLRTSLPFPDFFEQDISDAGPADLYFQEPSELINVFKSIETQNLNALIHLESLAEPIAQLLLTIQNAEQQIKIEVGEITSIINELRVMIYNRLKICRLIDQKHGEMYTYVRMLLGKHSRVGKQSHRSGKARERAFGNRVPGFRLFGGGASSSGVRRGRVRELRGAKRGESR